MTYDNDSAMDVKKSRGQLLVRTSIKEWRVMLKRESVNSLCDMLRAFRKDAFYMEKKGRGFVAI